MKTEAGIKLTDDEIKLVNKLKKLAKEWKVKGKDLWLFSGSGTLFVMMSGETDRNPNPTHNRSQGLNQNNIITTIDIPNDGGDW